MGIESTASRDSLIPTTVTNVGQAMTLGALDSSACCSTHCQARLHDVGFVTGPVGYSHVHTKVMRNFILWKSAQERNRSPQHCPCVIFGANSETLNIDFHHCCHFWGVTPTSTRKWPRVADICVYATANVIKSHIKILQVVDSKVKPINTEPQKGVLHGSTSITCISGTVAQKYTAPL